MKVTWISIKNPLKLNYQKIKLLKYLNSIILSDKEYVSWEVNMQKKLLKPGSFKELHAFFITLFRVKPVLQLGSRGVDIIDIFKLFLFL